VCEEEEEKREGKLREEQKKERIKTSKARRWRWRVWGGRRETRRKVRRGAEEGENKNKQSKEEPNTNEENKEERRRWWGQTNDQCEGQLIHRKGLTHPWLPSSVSRSALCLASCCSRLSIGVPATATVGGAAHMYTHDAQTDVRNLNPPPLPSLPPDATSTHKTRKIDYFFLKALFIPEIW
jgi:hypothetical protein